MSKSLGRNPGGNAIVPRFNWLVNWLFGVDKPAWLKLCPHRTAANGLLYGQKPQKTAIFLRIYNDIIDIILGSRATKQLIQLFSDTEIIPR
jgi:hypothetical protein